MKIYSLIVSAMVLVLVASCTQGTQGIFASIEREQKVVSLGGLSKTATVTSMAELTGVTPHLYFLTGGRNLFTKPAGTVTWNKQVVNGSSQVTAVGSVGPIGSEIVFAVAILNGTPTLYSTTDGSSWSQVTGFQSGDLPSDLLPVRNNDGITSDQLMVVTYNYTYSSDQPNYQNVYLISATGIPLSSPYNLMPSTGLSNGLAANPISAVYTGAIGTTGSPYYVASETYLWKINGGTVTNITVSTSSDPHHDLQGLLYKGSTLYLSTMSNSENSGGLYFLNNPNSSGSPFSFSTIVAGQSFNNSAVWFTQFLYNIQNNSLWVATGSSTVTQGTGYMEYSLSGGSFSTTPTTDTNNYNSTVLPSSAVGVLWADHESTTNPTYYLGTLSQGLWAWTGTTSADATWVQQ